SHPVRQRCRRSVTNTVTGDWSAVLDAMREAGQAVLDHPRASSELTQVNGARYLTRLFSGGTLVTVEDHDFDYPRFAQILSPWIQYGLFNPDASYLWAPVRGDRTYRIFGTRGTARVFHVEVYGGDYAYVSGLHVVDGGDDFVTGPNGEIEIILSRNR